MFIFVFIEEACCNKNESCDLINHLTLQLQRPGADDVMVLKKELVSVQTLMDQMTLESEEKGKEVEKERQDLQNLLDEARSQAQLVQEEFDAFKVSLLSCNDHLIKDTW